MNARVTTAIIALPILIAAVVIPVFFQGSQWANAPFVALAAAALGGGLFEFFSLAKRLELKGDAGVAYIASVVLFVSFALFDAPAKAPDLILLILTGFVIALLISQTFRFQIDFPKMLAGIGVTVVGVLYVAFLGSFIVAMRVGFESASFPHLSTKLLGFFFLTIMGADSGAYYLGRAAGKHKIVPKISPGKSWEGLAGGLVLSAALAAGASLTFFKELPLRASIPLALAMTVVGFFGDIAESAMKRGAGAKDAASILPGHGGLLDRLDSLLFNAPVLYYFALFYFTN